MRTLFIIALGAFLITLLSIPRVKTLAIALGFVDAPSKRKVHSTPMPLLGGLAIFGGAMVAMAVYYGRSGSNRDILAVLGAAAIIVVVGLIDDRKPLPAPIKLGGQLAAFLLAAYFGTRISLPIPLYANFFLTIIWMSVITNAINFLDNMDGLCAGVSAVACAFIMLFAALNEQNVIGPMAAAIFGACLGFLRYNFKPASIFMGDAGSLFLGFLLSVMALQLRFDPDTSYVTWMVPLFILGIPLFDLSLVMVSRLRRGVNPLTTAGKDHTSHRLVRKGNSQKEAVLLIYLAGCAFGMMAIFITRADAMDGYVIAGITVLIALYAIIRLEKWKA